MPVCAQARPDLANGTHDLAVAWSSSVQEVRGLGVAGRGRAWQGCVAGWQDRRVRRLQLGAPCGWCGSAVGLAATHPVGMSKTRITLEASTYTTFFPPLLCPQNHAHIRGLRFVVVNIHVCSTTRRCPWMRPTTGRRRVRLAAPGHSSTTTFMR